MLLKLRLVLLVIAATLGATTSLTAAPRPNVVLIMADDLNCALGCYSHPQAVTPHIDRLAARSLRFDRAYCQYPVCNPSRAALLSGRRPESTRIVDNATPPRSRIPDAIFLPQHFRQQGYRTLKVGKITHTGDEFEDSRSWDLDVRENRTAKNPPESQIVARPGDGGIVLRADDADTWDGQVARRAVALLEEHHAAEQPFFLAVGFRRPHTPYIAPQRYFDLYPFDRILPLVEPAEHLARIPPLALTYPPGTPPWSEQQRRETTAAYLASISFMDGQVGLLLDALDRHALWDRTVVLFVSDHGYHLGEHGGLRHKMTLFEEACRVPLLLAAPGSSAGSTSALVELVDLFPTLVELCDLPTPEGLEGTSFAPLLDDPQTPWKQAAFTLVVRGPQRNAATPKLDPARRGMSIRTPRWRYTRWFDGSHQLYDHDTDPREFRNLADDPDFATTVADLDRQLTAGWRAALPPAAK